MRMHVLIVTSIYPPDIGGPASYIPVVTSALHSRGHEVTILTMADTSGVEETGFGRVVRVQRNMGFLARKWEAYRELSRWVCQVDLIYAHGAFEELRLSLLGRNCRAKVVVKFAGDWAWERARRSGYYQDTIDAFQKGGGSFKNRLLRASRSLVASGFETIIVPSDYFGHLVEGWFHTPPNIQVIYNGIHIPKTVQSMETQQDAGGQGLRLCTICRLVSWKGVDQLIDMMMELPEATLNIIGEGPLQDELFNQVARLQLQDRVKFAGAILRSDALKQLAVSDVFVLNSDYEGLPHSVLEAMALKRAIVARRSGGSAEVLSHGQTGLIANNAQEFLSHLLTLQADPLLRRRLGENAYEHYKRHYTQEVMIQKTVQALEKLCG